MNIIHSFDFIGVLLAQSYNEELLPTFQVSSLSGLPPTGLDHLDQLFTVMLFPGRSSYFDVQNVVIVD